MEEPSLSWFFFLHYSMDSAKYQRKIGKLTKNFNILWVSRHRKGNGKRNLFARREAHTRQIRGKNKFKKIPKST